MYIFSYDIINMTKFLENFKNWLWIIYSNNNNNKYFTKIEGNT